MLKNVTESKARMDEFMSKEDKLFYLVQEAPYLTYIAHKIIENDDVYRHSLRKESAHLLSFDLIISPYVTLCDYVHLLHYRGAIIREVLMLLPDIHDYKDDLKEVPDVVVDWTEEITHIIYNESRRLAYRIGYDYDDSDYCWKEYANSAEIQKPMFNCGNDEMNETSFRPNSVFHVVLELVRANDVSEETKIELDKVGRRLKFSGEMCSRLINSNES